jgi:ribosome-binding protein aMBF1 (putative translation factor)
VRSSAGLAENYVMPGELQRPWRTLMKLREICGLSVEDLAKRASLRAEQIRAFEAGIVPNTREAEAMATVLGVDSVLLVAKLVR